MGETAWKMGGCISASTSCAICFSGIVFQICGLALLSYDIYYFLDVATNNLAYCMLGLGLWYVLAGIIAFAFSSHGGSKGLMISYRGADHLASDGAGDGDHDQGRRRCSQGLVD